MQFFLTYSFALVKGFIFLGPKRQLTKPLTANSFSIKKHLWTKSCFCYELFLAELKKRELKELPEWQGLKAALKRYFQGQAVEFSAWPVDLSSNSAFSQKVLTVVRGIKWGETMTYKQVAAEVGKPKAARAVGRIMSQNKLPLFVPCHRVIGVKNKMGWSGPVGLKQELLKLENNGSYLFYL